jgi:hypothetical protein
MYGRKGEVSLGKQLGLAVYNSLSCTGIGQLLTLNRIIFGRKVMNPKHLIAKYRVYFHRQIVEDM